MIRMTGIFYPNFLTVRKRMFLRMMDLVMGMLRSVHANLLTIR